MKSHRVARFVLPVALVVVAAGSAVAQQAAWGPSQQSMYHNHPGTAPTYTSYGKDTPTVGVPAQANASAPAPAKPAGAAAPSSKPVSGHSVRNPIKTRRVE